MILQTGGVVLGDTSTTSISLSLAISIALSTVIIPI